MLAYREVPPSPALADAVECCWISISTDASTPAHRVVPDGCADIIYRVQNGRPELLAVGAMTRFADISQSAEEATFGIRFRPGMWARVLGVHADELTDRTIPLEQLWGGRARTLRERAADAPSAAECFGILAEGIGPVNSRTPLQRAIGCLEARRGMIPLDGVARAAGLSVRQFRRVCLRETGLSPKLLARILRFRHAESRVAMESGTHAGLAAECGFADQSHMIGEFKRFAGRTPLGSH